MRSYTAAQRAKDRPRAQAASRVMLTPELIEEYLAALGRSGCAAETLKAYRLKLNQLYQYLPGDKLIQAGTLEEWREELMERGYSNSTINTCTSAANGLVLYCGHRELQIEKLLNWEYGVQPELTRNEYLRLLSTARILGKEREYLLVKTFGSTGLLLQDLPRVTVEAITEGKIMLPNSLLRFPECLREELLDYARRQGILSGPVFVTRNGALIYRSNVTKAIQSLCRDARVDEARATPRCLRKLYQATQDSIQSNIALLVEQAHDRMMEMEQLTIGWNQGEVWNG